MAHADDEFGVFAEIADAVARGHRVVCVYLTDGGFGGQSAEVRQRESLAVLRRLGVNARDVHFAGYDLRIADGGLPTEIGRATKALETVLTQSLPVARILVPAWEGGHQDHDAAHVAGLAACKRVCPETESLQFSLYTGHRMPGPFFRVLSPLAANGSVAARRLTLRERVRYLENCLSYPSQWRSWLGLFPFVLAHYVFVGKQQLQPVNPDRLNERPHGGRLLYERRGFYRWDDFETETRRLRAEAQSSIA